MPSKAAAAFVNTRVWLYASRYVQTQDQFAHVAMFVI